MSLAVGEKECPFQGKGTVQFLIKWENGKFNRIISKADLYNLNLRRNFDCLYCFDFSLPNFIKVALNLV